MTVTDAHRTMGIAIVAGWMLLFVFGMVLLARKHDAGGLYWGLLTALQVLLGLQLPAGLTQVALGAVAAATLLAAIHHGPTRRDLARLAFAQAAGSPSRA